MADFGNEDFVLKLEQFQEACELAETIQNFLATYAKSKDPRPSDQVMAATLFIFAAGSAKSFNIAPELQHRMLEVAIRSISVTPQVIN